MPPRVLAVLLAAVPLFAAAETYQPPASPRVDASFDADWRFVRKDVPGAEAAAFDDSRWAAVGLPHTWNDVDTYRAYIRHSHGDSSGSYRGIGWYRKHFRLPLSAKGGKVFVEFEGARQAAQFWINGHAVGRYKNGITACGLDLTPWARFGAADNVLAVKVDNSAAYKEAATGTPFEWNSPDFNPNFGGLNRNAWLHLTGPIYQTLPLYENLRTSGTYIYPTDCNVGARTATVNVEAQVRNETGDFASIGLSVVVVDADGTVQARFDGDATDLVAGQTETLTATGPIDAVRFWEPNDPHLYTVYSLLTVGGKVVDVERTVTGFRQTEFKGGAGTGGVYVNGRFLWLTGYAQRSVDDWAGLGAAYPDWMHDWSLQLLRSTHANYVRWMHTAPQPADVTACDRRGIVEVCPAGDKERDVSGRQWEQRVEVMRDTMIYYRNRPSILFWEAGNTVVTPAHLKDMMALQQTWDPHGGRVVGARGNDDGAANTALTPIAGYFGVMIGQAPQTDALKGQDAIFRGYSAARRDRAPLIETEDFRDEAARGIWDDASPPHFGFKPGPEDSYRWTSESFCLAGAARYQDYLSNRIDHRDPAHAKWSGYASIYWSDSDADGRQQSSAVDRESGKVDAVRLPKELYYVSRVMQSETPDLHIIGHWTYPVGTKKTVYVAASHCDRVELALNGQSLGGQRTPFVFGDRGSTGCIYAFPNVAFAPGTLRAVASEHGQPVAHEELATAGPAAALRLTPHLGPAGFRADGSDVAFFDVEAVDAQGRRCPTDEARVDFTLTGPAIWRGGVNEGRLNSTNNLYLNTECGINRVMIRSTRASGQIALTARRAGLKDAAVTLAALPAP